MKLKELKLSHVIKTTVFGILMLFPFFAALPSQLYFAFNEHAQEFTNQTITTTYEYETNEVNSSADLVQGHIYHFSCIDNNVGDSIYDYIDSDSGFNISGLVYNVSFESLTGDAWYSDENVSEPYFYIYCNADNTYNYAFPFAKLSDDNYQIMCLDNYSTQIYFQFDFVYNSQPDLVDILCNHGFIWASSYLGEATTTITNEEMNPLQAFYNANEQVWEQPLFNWVESSALQSSIGAFVSVFGLSVGSYFNNLITYWLSLTIIFIVINLVLDVIEWLIELAPFKKKKS